MGSEGPSYHLRFTPPGATTSRRAAFLDRDGVLNVDHGYVFRPEQFEWTEQAVDAIRWLNENGYLAIVVTNQSGIARGLYSERDFASLTTWAQAELAALGAHLDAVYFCPHHPEFGAESYRGECECRKPKPGMIRQAILDYAIVPHESFLIGDSPRDVEAAEAAGVRGFLFEGGSLLAAVQRATAIIQR